MSQEKQIMNEIIQLDNKIKNLLAITNIVDKPLLLKILESYINIDENMFYDKKYYEWSKMYYNLNDNDMYDEINLSIKIHLCYAFFLNVIINSNIFLFNKLFTYIEDTFDEVFKTNEKQKLLSLFQYDLKFNIYNNCVSFYKNIKFLDYTTEHIYLWYINYYTYNPNEDDLIINYYNPLENMFNIIKKYIPVKNKIIAIYLIYFTKLKTMKERPSIKLVNTHLDKYININELNENDILLLNILLNWSHHAFPYIDNYEEIMLYILNSDNVQLKLQQINNEITFDPNIKKKQIIKENYYKINNKKYNSINDILFDLIGSNISIDNKTDEDILNYMVNNFNFTILYNNKTYGNNTNIYTMKIIKENDKFIILCPENLQLNNTNKIVI